MNKIPLVDLKRQYINLKVEIDNTIQNVINKTAFINGNELRTFEENFSGFCGSKFFLGVSSGTDALYLILKALNIAQNDEVIIPVNTFIATAEAISLLGAKPVFVDIDEKTNNIDENLIEKAITDKTRAIIAVHLYGQPSNLDPIKAIADKYNLYLIEDAAQAHGAKYKNVSIGKYESTAAAFSFFPGKNLGAFGDAGGISTNNKDIYDKLFLFRNHGRKEKYLHEIEGCNCRLDNLQAAILDVKLKYLKDWNEQRRSIANLYNEKLENLPGITLPAQASYAFHVYHLYVVRVLNNRDEILNLLKEAGIMCGIHYPVPLHLQPAYKYLGYSKRDFPVAEQLASQIISLPVFPYMDKEEVEYICQKITEFCGG